MCIAEHPSRNRQCLARRGFCFCWKVLRVEVTGQEVERRNETDLIVAGLLAVYGHRLTKHFLGFGIVALALPTEVMAQSC
jgi:hypothetical protein